MVRLSTMLVACALLLNGCAGTSTAPILQDLYSRAAQEYSPQRNPVIVIPGILGSKLIDSETGIVVWGAFSGRYANPQNPAGARLCALPMRERAPLTALRDSVAPNGVLDHLTVNVLGIPIELDAYVYILGTLGVGGYRDETLALAGAIDYGDKHFTCFQFDYDWRRDNVENAQLLHEFIVRKRKYVQEEIERRFGIANYDVKFDIVAHSMGGLLARYYLQYGAADLPEDGSAPPVTWEGSRHVERAILIGTPNAGSVHALTELTSGRKYAPFLPRYDAALLGTMPAIYQLLPRGRHGAVVDANDRNKRFDNLFDPALWERMRWGLADPKQDRTLKMLMPEIKERSRRRRIALEHLAKCLDRARRFTEVLDAPATPPQGLSLHLIAGDGRQTDAVVAVSNSRRKFRVIEKAPGDGLVLRSSALLDERAGNQWQPTLVSPIQWSHVTFLFKSHVEMMRDPGFTDNLLHLLLEQPR